MSQNNFFNLLSFLKDNYDEAQIKENLLNNKKLTTKNLILLLFKLFLNAINTRLSSKEQFIAFSQLNKQSFIL